MAVVSYKMGPGTFKLGTAGVMDVSCQVTNLVVSCEESVETSDPIPVLCGEEIPGEDTLTHAWTVAGTLVQDISATGVVDYTWDNKGVVVDFEFIPNTVDARKVTGEVRLVPISVGGDVKTRPTSDFTWAVPSDSPDPVLAAVA